MTEPEPHQTTAQEVQDFISGRSTPAPPGPLRPPGVTDPTKPPVIRQVTQDLGQLPPEAEEFVKGTAVPRSVPAEEAPEGSVTEELPTEAPEEVRIDTEISPLTDPDAPTMRNNPAWLYADGSLGTIRVTDFEKTTYLKAAMNDEAIILDITLGTVNSPLFETKIRSLSHYEIDVIYTAVRAQVDDGVIPKDDMGRVDALLVNTWVQWYAACMQVMECQKSPQQHLAFSSDGDVKTDAEALRAHFTKKHRGMQAARWHALLTSLRIFEIKVKICNDSLANGNFWNPASAG